MSRDGLLIGEAVAAIEVRNAHTHALRKRNKRTVKMELTIRGGPA
jgi:hypothetical protein